MRFHNKLLAASIALAITSGSGVAVAKLSDADAARLGSDLTPLGGEVAGNKDGSIPKYEGGLTKPPACFKPGIEYCDPFAGEKPKFEITLATAEQYKDKLPAGALALLKKYPTFKIAVYPTHRTAAVPAEIAKNVKAEATKIELKGSAIVNRSLSTTPFPIPQNGLEAILNHNLRYLGGGFEREQSNFPVRANGETYRITTKDQRVYNQNLDTPQPNLSFYFTNHFVAPSTLVGTVFLVHEPVDTVAESRSAWIYNAGQRRVRRAPDLGYDGVNDGTEGLRFADQYDGYNGATDRFDWKLVGKREMYVPYNAYRLGEKKVKYADITHKSHPNPDLIRYELHRVWVVEATLKANMKHSFGKRTFLLDEDSWNVLWEDAYDTRGDLWRVGVIPLIQYYDAMVPWARATIHHDLNNGAYLLSGVDNESDGTIKFGLKGRAKDFQPDSLRRIGN